MTRVKLPSLPQCRALLPGTDLPSEGARGLVQSMVESEVWRWIDSVHFMVHRRTMPKLNIHEAKTHLSRYLAELLEGETILLCKRNVPIAEIRPLKPARTERRPIGLAKGLFEVPPEFFAPLPDDLLDAFEGK